MARRRDWDKMRRNDAVRLNGSLPHWMDNWAPCNSDSTPYYAAPALAHGSGRQHVDEPKSTVSEFVFEFENHTKALNLPMMMKEDTKELIPARTIVTSKVTLVLNGLLDASEQEFFNNALMDVPGGALGKRLSTSRFEDALSSCMHLRRIRECDFHVTFEYERKPVAICPPLKIVLKEKAMDNGMTAKMVKAAILKEKPNLKGRALRIAVNTRLRSQML